MIKSFEVPKENCKKMVMSSLEIAKATGKMHKHVIRDIRTMEEAWEKVTGTKFGLSEYKDKTGRKLPCYILKYDECMLPNGMMKHGQNLSNDGKTLNPNE